MILSQPIARFRNVVLRPHGMQFVIDELHLVSVCVAGLVYGGMEAMPLCGMATAVSLFLLLVLAYRFIYLRLIRYRIGGSITWNCTVSWTFRNTKTCCNSSAG